jgi:hypothetical protein
MIYFRKLINKFEPSIILIFLSYFLSYFIEFQFSKYFGLYSFFFILLIVLLLQFLIHKLFLLKNILLFYFAIFLYSSIFMFLFGINFVVLSNKFQYLIFKEQLLNGSLFFILSFLSFLIFESFIFRCRKRIFVQNVFFLVYVLFSLFSFFSNFTRESSFKGSNVYKEDFYLPSNFVDGDKKSILFFIVDEYASPYELYEINKDSSIFTFQNELISKGWITKNKFYTKETKTISSLTSLFNFGQTSFFDEKIKFKNVPDVDKLIHSKLGDSLIAKDIKIFNLGIFDIEYTTPLTRLFYYPTNFYEEFLKYTIYPQLHYNTNGFQNFGFNSNASLQHNKFIFNNLRKFLSKLEGNNNFIYVHLFMPHSPYSYEPEFKYRKENPFNYFQYWKFTNNKVSLMLDSIVSLDKYKIIVTGDHGFRGSQKINPNYTFSCFYGFDECSLDSINNVQDLGVLINSGF